MKIKKESKLYKVVDKMSSILPFSLYMAPDEWSDYKVPSTFNDVCTFIRHFLLTAFIVIPITLIIILVSIAILILIFIISPLEAIRGYNGAGYFVILCLMITILSYVSLVFIQHYMKNKPVKVDAHKTEKEPSIVSQILDVLKEKNSKICKKIDIE